MKRHLIILAALFTFITSASAQDEMAVSEQQARTILNEMSEKAKGYKTIKIKFSLTNESKRDGAKQMSEGSLSVKKEKYVLDIFDMVTYNDGTTVSLWQKKNNEVDISDPDADAEGDLSPSKLFSAYKSGYKLRLLGDRKIGNATCTEIDLYPTEKKQNIIRIRLSIDNKSKQIKQLQQQMKNGDTMTISIEKFEIDTPMSDALFVFDAAAHPNVEVVDLR